MLEKTVNENRSEFSYVRSELSYVRGLLYEVISCLNNNITTLPSSDNFYVQKKLLQIIDVIDKKANTCLNSKKYLHDQY